MFRSLRLVNSYKLFPENITNCQKNVRFCSKRNDNSSSSDDSPGNQYPQPENPIEKTFRILGKDVKIFKNNVGTFVRRVSETEKASKAAYRYQNEVFPEHCDIAIIGGGAMGSSIAYWLKQKVPNALSVTVIERDPSYCVSSTALSVGGIRQQFSLEENIKMSLFGADFLRNIKDHLTVEGHDPPNVCFTPYGYLFLASEAGAGQMEENSRLQAKLGAKNELLSPAKLKERFPWLNTDGIVLGCHGLENEGWFDPWCLLSAFKKKAISLGVEYVNGEAIGFEFKKMPDVLMEGIDPGGYEALDKVVVKMENGELKAIKFAIAIIAAGPYTAKIAEKARIGTGQGVLSIPVPIEPRKRYVYCFNCKTGPGLNTPLTIDPSGVYFRREGLGGNYIGGRSPSPEQEPNIDNLDVDYNFFDTDVWPTMAHRIPEFECIKVNSAWAGYYEYNTFDQNGIVGPHPYYNNLYIAAGFSGHGIQQSPAVGRAVMEMILDNGFQTIDLTRMSFDRLITDMPIREHNIW